MGKDIFKCDHSAILSPVHIAPTKKMAEENETRYCVSKIVHFVVDFRSPVFALASSLVK